jgi:hypothetical protein
MAARPVTITTIRARFWPKVQRLILPELCWPWQGEPWEWQDGYGRMNIGQSRYLAHRIALALSEDIDIRDIPPDQCALHSCDFRPCCRPGHLRWGTRLDNAKDFAERGERPSVRGILNPNARLDEVDVRAIKIMLRSGRKQTEAAAVFGVTRQQIWKIAHGKQWQDDGQH